MKLRSKKIQIAQELHKRVIKNFKTRRIIINGIDEIWACDLLIMIQYSKQNRGYKYLLNVIDCFSKYVWCVALKEKTGSSVTDAFVQILKKSKRKPSLLHADMGKEFVNSTFKKMLEEYKIKLYHTFSENKSSIIERFNRSLNEKLRLHFEINKNFHWYKILPAILKEYNEKDVHRTTGMTPAKASLKQNEEKIYSRMYPLKKFRLQKPIFKIDDRVRIIKKKNRFGNKYTQNWTTEIFVVSDIHYTDPITYSIKALDGEEILGKFYRQELQKTKF